MKLVMQRQGSRGVSKRRPGVVTGLWSRSERYREGMGAVATRVRSYGEKTGINVSDSATRTVGRKPRAGTDREGDPGETESHGRRGLCREALTPPKERAGTELTSPM